MNECHLIRDHFKKKCHLPSSILQPLCLFSGQHFLFFIFLSVLNSSNAVISENILTFPLVNQQIISNFILFSLTKQSHGFSGSGKYDPYQVLSKGRLLSSKRGIHRRHLDGFDTFRYICTIQFQSGK